MKEKFTVTIDLTIEAKNKDKAYEQVETMLKESEKFDDTPTDFYNFITKYDFTIQPIVK